MQVYLHKILQHELLNAEDCEAIIDQIASSNFNATQLTAILTHLHIRGEQLEELNGFRAALLRRVLPVELDSDHAIDLCGTGGDGKSTFNISTTSSLVLAAMGYKVIKHGNHGVSSICGSSTVLEALGIPLRSDVRYLTKELAKKNVCFLHAPLFHPTLKQIGTLRKELGIRTLFNALGPLVNPAQPKYQLTGTYSLELAKSYAHILHTDNKYFSVVHGVSGYDEITLTDQTRSYTNSGDKLIQASDFLQARVSPEDVCGGKNPTENAQIIRNILQGKGSKAQMLVVAANVTEARMLYLPTENKLDIFQETHAFILSGQGAKHFNFL